MTKREGEKSREESIRRQTLLSLKMGHKGGWLTLLQLSCLPTQKVQCIVQPSIAQLNQMSFALRSLQIQTYSLFKY